MTTFSNFAGYVLAGGKSSRMNKNKAFLEIDGETFLERAVKTLSAVCESPVRIVVKLQQNYMLDRFPENAKPLYDKMDFDSPLDGLYSAFWDSAHGNRGRYAVVLAVDLPFVTVQAIEKLADIADSSNKFIAVVPRQTDGRLQPLCAVYHARYCLPMLESLISKNASASVRDFLELIAPRLVDQNKLSADQSKDIFFNVNHPADFQTAISST